jgi:hypothetical protein
MKEKEGYGFEVEEIYNLWFKSWNGSAKGARMFAVNQTLHPKMLREIETPINEIAGFVLTVARDETLRWVDERRFWFPEERYTHNYDKVLELRTEIRKTLRKEAGTK